MFNKNFLRILSFVFDLYVLILFIYCLIAICLLIFSLLTTIEPFTIFSDSGLNMNVEISSESNKITVFPDQNTRTMSNSDIVDFKFEFNLPHEKILEITEFFGTDVINNVITGSNAEYIINRYIVPIIHGNTIDPWIYELFTKFIN